MSEFQPSGGPPGGKPRIPLLEWIASSIGLLLALAITGFIGWQAYRGAGTGNEPPPAIEVRAERIVAAGGGWVVEFVAVNRSPSTAAAVLIDGRLSRGGRELASSQVSLDYVPGHSERRGGLFFTEDPQTHAVALRALGYARP